MKKTMSKTEAKRKIEDFFKQDIFSGEEMRKVKRLAMKFRIRLGDKRKLFCKKCYEPLKGSCGCVNKHKLS
jgi:RNase P subunit RPR2